MTITVELRVTEDHDNLNSERDILVQIIPKRIDRYNLVMYTLFEHCSNEVIY